MPEVQNHISVDSILVTLGTFGRYQMIQGFLMCLANVSITVHLLCFVFIAQPVKHQCEEHSVSNNISNNLYGTCKVTKFNTSTNATHSVSCNSWRYAVQKQHSIVSEWDLVCDDEFFARLPQSLFIVGQAIGALVFSNLSDKFGRKPFLLLSEIMTACAGVALSFAPNIAAFSALRMINGICQQGVVMTSATLLLEIFPTNKRATLGTFYLLTCSVGSLLLTLMAYLLRHLTWRMLQLSFVTVSTTALFNIIFLRESLRWLITNRKAERASEILKLAGKLNHVDVSSISLQQVINSESVKNKSKNKEIYVDSNTVCTSEKTVDTKYTLLSLLKSKFMLKISAVIWFTWLVDSLTYFSLYLTQASLADDMYLNVFLNSLAEIPTAPLYWLIGRRWGRRNFFVFCNTLAGTCLLLATGIKRLEEGDAASLSATILAFLGKVGNTACFNGLFVYVPEIYPTNLRTAGMGAGSTAARVGGCIAPFISMLAAVVSWAPGTMFGVLCLVAAGLNYILPESKGHELPETIAEIKSWKN